MNEMDGPQSWSAAVPLAVASALFMDLADSSALATALPALAEALHTDPLDLKLALTANLLTIAIFVPASGWLADRVGAKRLFLTAMATFLVGSVFCALSHNLAELVAARIVQGIGGAMMTPVGRSIIVGSVPRDALVRAMMWFTMPAILGPMLGPPLAGLVLELGSWRWIFLLNLPVGLLGIVAVSRLVPTVTVAHRIVRFDFVGLMIMGCALAAVLIVPESNLVGHSSPLAKLAIVLAIAGLFAAYWRHAIRHTNPLVDLNLLRLPSLRVSLISGSFARLPLGAMPLLLPLLLQIGMGYPPLVASQVMVAIAIGALVSRFTTEPVIAWLGMKKSMLVFGVGAAVFAATPMLFTKHTPLPVMATAMGLAGLLRASFFVPIGTLAYAEVNAQQVGQTTVLFTVAQQVSMAMGVNIAAMLMEHGSALTPDNFMISFLAIAVLALLALIPVLAMREDVGATLEIRRR